MLRRNQAADYLNLSVLAGSMGAIRAAAVLGRMDGYYTGQNRDGSAASSQIVRQLADPKPKDPPEAAKQGCVAVLSGRWLDWAPTVAACRGVAVRMLTGKEMPWR